LADPDCLLLEEADFALEGGLDEDDDDLDPPAVPRKRRGSSLAEWQAARKQRLLELQKELQQGPMKTFERQASVSPVEGWLANVPTVDAVQERRKQLEAERAKKKGLHPELQAYLRAPPQPKDSDPLLWWKTDGQKGYPNLARAAKSFLAVPATTAASERCFSEGRQAVAWTRHQLRDEMIEANMCLKSWFQFFK
jgi:hypothetical protein